MTNTPVDAAYFVMDAAAAEKCCHEAVQADHAEAERLLLQALTLQPSCMLAYHLLAERYTEQGLTDKAAQCRRGLLPPKTLAEPQPLKTAQPTSFERTPVFESSTQALPAPTRIEDLKNPAPLPAFFKQTEISSKPCFVDQLSGGRVWHDAQHTVVLNANNSVLVEHPQADHQLIGSLLGQYQPFHIQGRAFLIGARGAHNFYHWMTDIIPKLGVLLRAGCVFTQADRFIVPYANAEFCFQLLAQFGVDRSQVYETEKQHVYISADTLVVPFVENKMALTMGRWLPELMREQFLAVDNTAASDRRLFITRAAESADGRQISNQTVLQQHLEACGFKCVQTENYSVAQQAVLFSQASVVVAAHGAALSNLVFCRPGTTVIELYAGHIAPCFWAISALCELQYYQQYCGAGDDFAHGTAAGRSTDLTVPMDQFNDLLLLAGVKE